MNAASHLKRLSVLLGVGANTERMAFIDPTTFTVEDAPRLEHCFPSCTVALDINPRIQTWEGHRLSVQLHHQRDVPEDGQAAILVAFRTNREGAYVQTRTAPVHVRMGAQYFVERAVYVPSHERWTVLR